ncbi:MAG: S8 family serine peptidase [Limnobacter sp.]|uniref:S8 family peptidase n=1 Tax=Limnobacter sp. TaxID=2003368 RepID=UPI0032ED1F65
MLTFRPKKQKLTPLRILVTSVLLMLWILLVAPAYAQGGSGQFIVKLKNSVELGSAPTLRRLEKEGEFLADVMSRNNVDAVWLRAGSVGTHVMRWGSSVRDTDQQAVLNRLASDPEVEFAIEDRPVRAFATPNDPNFSNQWALRSTLNTAGAKFDQAWDVIRGSADVVVAVLDTGVVFETPDLMGRLLSGYDFISDVPTANDGDGRDANAADPGNWISTEDSQTSTFSGCSVKNSSWHGTFVAGQVAANTHSDSDVAGADWNVKVLPVRVLGKCGGLLSDVLDAMLWSAGLDVPGIPRNPNPADVINLSLGSSSTCSTFEQSVVDRVNAAGTLVVAAAGNSGGSVDSPANCSNVLSVGALDRDGSRASYSAIGSGVSLMAPGGFTNGLVGLSNSGSTTPGSASLASKTGTSFAAPLVAATAGLMRSINPTLTPAQLRSQILNNTAGFLSPGTSTCTANQGSGTCNCTTAVCGAGMLDAFAVVSAARASSPVANASVSANGLGTSGFQESASGLNPVRLRGSASSVALGRTVASYQWIQVSGEQVMTGTRNTADVDLPAATATSDLVFQLTVTDSVGENHSSFTAIRVVASGDDGSSPSSLASASSGGTTAPTTNNSTTSTASVASGGGGGGGGANTLGGLFGLMALLLAFKMLGRASSKE